jgi:hypothetical protein
MADKSAPPATDVDAGAGWSNVADVKAMTLDQLQAASTALSAALERYNSEIAWRNAAFNQVRAEISERFAINVPGAPSRAALPQYPADKVASTFEK